jgi:hypothetical protein
MGQDRLRISYSNLLIAMALLLLASSCRRDPVSWDVGLYGPLVNGRLDISDMIPDSLLVYGEGGLVIVSYQRDLLDFNLDTLADVPDTTIHNSFTPGLGPGQFTVPAGISVIAEDQETYYNLGEAQLREIRVKSGRLRYEVRSYMNAWLDFEYALPGIISNGNSIAITENTAPGSSGQPFISSSVYDLSGYTLFLNGDGSPGYNTFVGNLMVQTSLNHPEGATIGGNDSIAIDLIFEDITLSYARGYFGSESEVNSGSSQLDIFGNISADFLDIDQVTMSLELVNMVGVDAGIRIASLRARNSQNGLETELTGADINTPVLLHRAVELGNSVQTGGTHTFLLNQDNSSLDELIELLPDQINYTIETELNPLGDISFGNDFIYTDRTLEGKASINLPLCFRAGALTLRDTLKMDESLEEQSANGVLRLSALNGFPFSANLTLKVLDENGMVLVTYLSDGNILAGATNGDEVIPVSSQSDFVLSEGDLNYIRKGNRWVIEAVFNTFGQEYVKIRDSHFIDFEISGDLNYTIEVE